jgi:hypothetical protein
MAKLIQKKWLTLEEAAKHLSNLAEEQVTVKDLIHYAMTGTLTLSVFFPYRSSAFSLKPFTEEREAKWTIEYSTYAGPHCEIDTRKEVQRLGELTPLWHSKLSPQLQKAAKSDVDFNHNVEALRELKTLVPAATGLFFSNVELDGGVTINGEDIYLTRVKGWQSEHPVVLPTEGLWEIPYQDDWAVYLETLLLEMDEHDAGQIGLVIAPSDMKQYTWPPRSKKSRTLKIFARKGELWRRPIFSELPKNARIMVTPANLMSLLDMPEYKNSNDVMDFEARDNETELNRLQRTVAALALGLMKKHGNTYNRNGEPNASQLAKVATDHLRGATSDRTPHGFSDTTVRQTITAALKACPELKG